MIDNLFAVNDLHGYFMITAFNSDTKSILILRINIFLRQAIPSVYINFRKEVQTCVTSTIFLHRLPVMTSGTSVFSPVEETYPENSWYDITCACAEVAISAFSRKSHYRLSQRRRFHVRELKLWRFGCYQFCCLVNRGTIGVNSLPTTVTRKRRDCNLNPGPSAPESSTLTTRYLM